MRHAIHHGNGRARRRSARRCVAHITLGLDLGGQEKLLLEFARHANRNYDLCFVSLTDRGKLADALEELGCTVIALDEPPGLRPRMVWRLARLLRSRRPGALHTHHDKPRLYGAPAARLAGVARLIHTHHHGPLPQFQRRHTAMVAVAARLTDRFVCVSRANARYMIRQGVPARKVRVVRNGIELSFFRGDGPNLSGPIVAVGRLSREKDQQTLLEATALVADRIPDIRLEIAGDGPCRAELERRIRDLKLEKHVRLLGEVRDVPALLSRARLFVLSSISEGMSLTLLEAMASGLPVVATRVGGNAEVVTRETGVLVPPRDPRRLARAVISLWSAPEAMVRLGRAGRARAEAHFDVRRMVASYETLYQTAEEVLAHL